jgi:hypothetical protein
MAGDARVESESPNFRAGLDGRFAESRFAESRRPDGRILMICRYDELPMRRSLTVARWALRFRVIGPGGRLHPSRCKKLLLLLLCFFLLCLFRHSVLFRFEVIRHTSSREGSPATMSSDSAKESMSAFVECNRVARFSTGQKRRGHSRRRASQLIRAADFATRRAC